MDYKSPSRTSLEETDRILREAEKLIVSTPRSGCLFKKNGNPDGILPEPNTGGLPDTIGCQLLIKLPDEVTADIRKKIGIISTWVLTGRFWARVIGDMLET